jgi:hypothetical protein
VVTPILGPANCHACHAPGQYLMSVNPPRWLERRWRRVNSVTLESRFVIHACTAVGPILSLKTGR